jgi:hypothetical protein
MFLAFSRWRLLFLRNQFTRRFSDEKLQIKPLPFCYPLITPIGRSRATFLANPALVNHFDHLVYILVGFRKFFQDSIARFTSHHDSVLFELALLLASIFALCEPPSGSEGALLRDKRSQSSLTIARCCPTSTQDAVPMLPGMKPGCPIER